MLLHVYLKNMLFIFISKTCKDRRGAAVAPFAASPDLSTPALSRRRHYTPAENKNTSN